MMTDEYIQEYMRSFEPLEPCSESTLEREGFRFSHDPVFSCVVYEDNAGGLHMYVLDDEGDLVWAHDYSAHPREVSDCAYDVKSYLCGDFTDSHIDFLNCQSPFDPDGALRDLKSYLTADCLENGQVCCLLYASPKGRHGAYFALRDVPCHMHPGISGRNFLAHFFHVPIGY